MSSGASAPIRLMNKQVNAYWGMVDKNTPQSAVYIHGQAHPPGFEGGLPTWIPIEFESVAAYEAMDGILSLPNEFTLLCLLGYSSQAAGVAFQLYDACTNRWISDKLAEGGLLTGIGGGALIDRVPHTFVQDAQGNDPQIQIRVSNQAAVAADIMIALYGVVGGAQD